jgi:hypothetical protein
MVVGLGVSDTDMLPASADMGHGLRRDFQHAFSFLDACRGVRRAALALHW